MTSSDRTDRIMSVCAIVGALAAVIVSAYEARINREYQRISVWPRINQSNSFVPGDPYQRTVSNVGIGPAVIQSVEISVDGVKCRNWAEVIKHMIGKSSTEVYSSFHAGSVLFPGKDVTVLKLPPGDDARNFWQQAQGNRLSVRICYASLYHEFWMSDSLAEQPVPVSQCRSDPEKEFQQ